MWSQETGFPNKIFLHIQIVVPFSHRVVFNPLNKQSLEGYPSLGWIGLGLDPSTVTKEELKNSIIDVVENNKYSTRIREIRHLLYDKPLTGLEKAVWWSEYVLRHEGATHLRSPAADFSWFEYLIVKVVLGSAALISVVIYLLYKVFQLIMLKCRK
ncbi:hypothetical protein Zmor_028148 [Zophobas morio]|uniref:Uncharacterized protein n=1 Tax=Zophobas morio TaxID=2755281 RepID=A0AA38M379_9CUCU|nr:hypothetical protein Zmor_028148 [Zophobas morio]